MKLLYRLRYILEVCRPPLPAVTDVLEILARICRHSTQAASEVSMALTKGSVRIASEGGLRQSLQLEKTESIGCIISIGGQLPQAYQSHLCGVPSSVME